MKSRNLGKIQKFVIIMLSLFFLFSNAAMAQLNLEAIPTFENMSIEFRAPSGVGSEKNIASLKYRRSGSGTWLNALDLYFNADNSLYAGSVVNLQPDTQYEFSVRLNSGESGTVNMKTWSEKFQVGETVYLPKVTTKTYEIRESGSPGAYRLYTFDPAVGSATLDGQGSLDYNIQIAPGVHHIIIDGLVLKNVLQNNILIGENSKDIIIQNNELTKWGRNPYENSNAEGAISDENKTSTKLERIVIQGNRIHSPNYGSWSWERDHPQGPSGVMFRNTIGNHVIRYNTIEGSDNSYLAYGLRGADNYSFDGGYGYNTDIYGNYIQKAWAAGIESEGGNKNNRVYENFLENTFSNFNFSVASVGPLYIYNNITGRTRRDENKTNSDTWGQSSFLKTGGNNTYQVKRIYLFNNLTLQPPPVGGGTGYGSGAQKGWSDAGASTSNGEPRNIVALNNIFLRNSGDMNHGILDLKSGDECTNTIDYNMFLGSYSNCTANPFQQNGIRLRSDERPNFDSGNGANEQEFLNRSTLEGKFYLAAGAPGQGDGASIPNFLEGSSIDMGPHQRGESAMKFGHKAFKAENNQPPVNTKPLISDLSDRTIQQDALLTDISFTIDDKETDASALVLSATSSNQNVVKTADIKFGGSGKERIFSVKPVLNATGVSTITLTVSDGALQSSSSFILTIQAATDKPTNSAPVLTAVEDKVYTEGASVSIQIKADDPDGDKLTYSASGLPASLSIDSATGIIRGTAATKGIYAVKVKVADQEGLFDDGQFNLTVSGDLVASQALLLINSGGGAVTFKEQNWEADQYAKGGQTYSNAVAIQGTDSDKIYQSERYGEYSYQIPLTTGSYDVKLHFAEIYHGVKNKNGVGARVFNVNVENGQGSLQNYDIIKSAGGPATAVVETIKDVKISDGFLSIALSAVKNHPKISAIEIISLGGKVNEAPVISTVEGMVYTAGTAISLQINAKDPDEGDLLTYSATGLPSSLSISQTTGVIQGKVENIGIYTVTVNATDQGGLFDQTQFSLTVKEAPVTVKSMYNYNTGGSTVTYNEQNWQSDQYVSGGQTNTNSIAIAATGNDKIYQSERYGEFTYQIPLSKGRYDVKLHFAEIFHGVKNTKGIGARVFDVNIENGQGSLLNYDIIKSAGGSATAVVENISGVYVTDGYLTLDFKAIKNHPKISAIEIVSLDNQTESPGEISTKLNVYPNPFDEVFTIDFGTSNNSEIKLTIFDSFGQKVYDETISAEDSTRPHEVDLSMAPLKDNEIYYIRTIEGGSIKKFARAIKK